MATLLLLEQQKQFTPQTGRKFYAIFINNAVYGMTGGQMARLPYLG